MDNINYYIILVRAYEESSKHDKVPFDGRIIYKILHLSLSKIPNFNFHNIIYNLMEIQEKNGFIITTHMRSIIDDHRKKYNQTPLLNLLEKMLFNLVT